MLFVVSILFRAEAVEASERARVVAEFQQRRREAAVNKARGQAQWRGPPLPTPQIPKQLPLGIQAVRGGGRGGGLNT